MSAHTQPQSKKSSADLVSLVAALIFGAAGVIVLAGESLADIDLVVLAGVALIVIGAARFVMAPVRAIARRRSLRAERAALDPGPEDEDPSEDGEDSAEEPDEDRVRDQVTD
ncbi:MAG: hypothetical protein OXF75_00795 [Acidimicrobiaceae bacterium]|nr:hypothetical protein [Acidimicrobiaceae bacterium]